MGVTHTISRLAGRLLRPVRAGDRKLAGAKGDVEPTIQIESGSFPKDGPIPASYAGATGRSPALRWSGVPEGTQDLVLLVEDPDAPVPKPFVHWLVHGLPPSVNAIEEGQLPEGAVTGVNSMKRDGWYGPQPPPGHGTHHYHFQLFALDKRLNLGPSADRDQVIDAMRNHVLASGDLVGTYERN